MMAYANEKEERESQDSNENTFEPAYLSLYRQGELARRAEKAWQALAACRLCPRACGAARLEGATGFCRAPGTNLVIASYHPHFGEERPLVGRNGSGTIFFSHCSLRCVFCQNWEISHHGEGDIYTIEDLCNMMLRLQERGCHNINFVTPTHYLPHILKALDLAVAKGLTIPLVYNTSGWECLEWITLLDGIVDIYLPDFKIWNPELAERYLGGAQEYPECARQAILEMHRQVGVAHPGPDRILRRGLMIRHLVLPEDAAGSESFLDWVATHLPHDTYVNLMAQYAPAYQASQHPSLARWITEEEYRRVVDHAKRLGLTNLDIQGRWLFR